MRFGLGVGVSKLTGVKGVPGKLIGVARGTGAFRGGLTQSLKGSVSSSALVTGVLSKKVALIGALTAATAFGGALTAGSAAALDLPFSTMSSGADLTAKGVTFTRSGLATQYDSTGKLTYAPNNLFIQSNNPSSWGLNNAVSITNAAGTGPFGANDAVQVTLGTTNYLYQSVNFGAGVRHIVSAYVKGTAGQKVLLRFDMSGTDVDTPVTFDGTWQRVSIYGTPSSTSGLVGFDNRSSVGSAGANGIGSSSLTFLFGGMQFEAVTYQTAPRPYVATTSAAYYGPRFDYDPATLAAKGLLIEESRTNLLQYSGDQTNAVYSVNNFSSRVLSGTAPDGGACCTATEAATNTSHQLYVGAGIAVSAATYTFSVFLKAGTRRYVTVEPNAGGGLGVTIDTSGWTMTTFGSPSSPPMLQNCGNGVYRVSIPFTTPATTIYPCIGGATSATNTNSGNAYLGDGSTIICWGWQLEPGSFATSYIPTTSASVTRAGEQVGKSDMSWLDLTKGTFYAEFDMPKAQECFPFMVAYQSANQLAMDINPPNDGYFGPNYADGQGLSAAGSMGKYAGSYDASGSSMCSNGGTVGTSTAFTFQADYFWIGSKLSGQLPINGHLKTLQYYNTRKTNAELQSLTT